MINSLPALTRIVSQATEALQRPGTPPSPNVIALFGGSENDVLANYITFAKGRIFLLTTHPPTVGKNSGEDQDAFNARAIDRLRELVGQTKAEVPGVNVGITGEPVLDYDEMTQSQKDTTLASIVSLVLCALIFIYGYNETGRPVKADDLPGGRIRLHAGVHDADRRPFEHFDHHVRADAHRAGD